MRIFVLVMVAVFGVALFAVAALAWDRRRELSDPSFRPFGRIRSRKPGSDQQAAGAGSVGAEGGQAPAGPGEGRRFLPHGIALASVLIGIAMIIGSCAGILRF